MINLSNAHYAGFWIRLIAVMLDAVIIGVPAWILAFLLTLSGVNALSYLAHIAAAVFTIYMDGMKGGTPGKLILRLNIVNEQGNFIGMPGAIIRYISKLISGLILGIGYLMIAFTQKKQGLHDFIAKTYVVRI